jgi:hypothetical protein
VAGRKRRGFGTAFLAAFLGTVVLESAFPQDVKLAPEVRVLLPEGGRVRVDWVLPPSDRSLIESSGGQLCFSIDGEGLPWVGLGGRLVLNPVKGYRAVLSVPFENFFHVGQDALLFATYEDFGFIQPAGEPEYDEATGEVMLSYQPLAAFPGLPEEEVGYPAVRRVFRGDDCLYFLNGTRPDESPEEMRFEVFSLKPGGAAGNGPGSERLPAFQTVLVSEESIGAVSGDGEITFVAVLNRIYRVEKGAAEPTLLYEHPSDMITGLDYNRQAGLFYATGSTVGVVKEGTALEFLKAPSPALFLRGNELYVMLGGSTGIVRFENAADFQKYNAAEREIVAVNGARFKEGPAGVQASLLFAVVWLGLGLLWFAGLVDVLKHRFPASTKVVWVILFLLGGLAMLALPVGFLLFGVMAGAAGFTFIAIFVVLSYFLMGKRQRLD